MPRTKICRDISCKALRNVGRRVPDFGVIVARRMRGPARRLGAALAVLALGAACGKKAPPLAPLNMAPEAPKAVTTRRLGDTVYLQMTVPDEEHRSARLLARSSRRVCGDDRPGARRCCTADRLSSGRRASSRRFRSSRRRIRTRRPDRPIWRPPLPGDTITFVEQLTEAQLVPVIATTGLQEKVATPKAPRIRQWRDGTVRRAGARSPVLGHRPTVLIGASMSQGAPSAARGDALLTASRGAVVAAAGRAARRRDVRRRIVGHSRTWQPPASSTDEAPGVCITSTR